MEKINNIGEYFKDVGTTEEHKGYFCSVWEALVIIILGSFCGLESVQKIHQWATSAQVREFLTKYLGIKNIPCNKFWGWLKYSIRCLTAVHRMMLAYTLRNDRATEINFQMSQK